MLYLHQFASRLYKYKEVDSGGDWQEDLNWVQHLHYILDTWFITKVAQKNLHFYFPKHAQNISDIIHNKHMS